MHQAAQAVQIARHGFWIDHQAIDEIGQSAKGEIEMHGGVRRDGSLHRRVADVPLVPEGDVLQGRDHCGADQARQAGEVLGEDGIALVGHGGGALLARLEGLFDLANLGALQVADLHRQALDGRRDHGQGGEIGGVPVAGNDLAGDRLDAQPELFGDVRLHRRIDAGEGADGSGNGAGGDLEAGHGQALAGAGELGVVAGELEAKGGGLGVDAVAAPDGGGQAVFEGATLKGGEHRLDVFQQQIRGAGELDGQGGVVDVRGGHALVQEARFGADDLGDVGQKGEDVVPDLALDLIDALDIENGLAAAFPDRLGRRLGDDAEGRHGVGGMGLDLEHDAKTRLGRPDFGGHGARVAGDHGEALA